MASKRVRLRIEEKEGMCCLTIPFDPKVVFGKVRAPVKVTLGDYTYRTTICKMGGHVFVPLRRSHREAAGVSSGQQVTVPITLDEEKRKVTPPADLARALKAAPHAWQRWQELSFTHQREYAEAVTQAKRPETRQRRIDLAVKMIAARPARKAKVK